MPLLGAHMSISGGLEKALFRGETCGCQVIQLFTRNPNQWVCGKLSSKEIDAFHTARIQASVVPVAGHDSYLINLASPRPENRRRSLQARGPAWDIGFEQLAEMIDQTESQDRLGVCLDTCHIFAAGYDFGDRETFDTLVRDFDAIIGLSRLKVIHVNDSKKERGSRIDRHEHIGQGLIGERAFSFLLKAPAFKDLPFILETPKGTDAFGEDLDTLNLGVLRRLRMEE